MTERPVPAGAAGSAPPPVNLDPPSPALLNGSHHPDSPLTPSLEVPQALLERAAPTVPDNPDVFARPDPLPRRYTDLLHRPDHRPAFDVPHTPGRSPHVAAAVACPDLFLIDAPPHLRRQLVADLVEAATRDGQRVLVVTADADAVVEALVSRLDVGIARALAADETAKEGSPTAAALAHRDHAAARDHLAVRVRECGERVAVLDLLNSLAAEEADVRAALATVNERAAALVDASDVLRELAAKRDADAAAVAAHREQRTAVEHELADLRQHAAPSGGFLKRLFGGGAKPADLQPKIDAAEAKLRELDAHQPADPDEAFRAERERLIAAEVANLRAPHDADLARITAERDGLLLPAGTPEQVRSELREWSEALADFDTRPAALSDAAHERIRVVVGPVAAVGLDPLLTTAHPEAAPRFDRVIVADADALTEDEFAAAARLAPTWVLVGTPDAHRPAYRNGTHPPKPRAAFGLLWEALRGSGWEADGDRLLARLMPVPADARHQMACEPLVGRDDFEVRFTDADGSPVLAEVLFPAGMPVCEAKAFLAAEADEVRFAALGPAVWHETTDAITCTWPACGDDGVGVELAAGVTERVVGSGAAALTAAVAFDPAAGWTRDSAADWLAARTSPNCRTAVVR